MTAVLVHAQLLVSSLLDISVSKAAAALLASLQVASFSPYNQAMSLVSSSSCCH